MTLLTREAIFAAIDLKRETVLVPQWGGAVLVSELCEQDAEEFLASDKSMIGLAALCCVTEAGERLFSPDDIAKLKRKNSRALRRVYDACMRVNGFGEDNEAATEKKSAREPGVASTSA